MPTLIHKKCNEFYPAPTLPHNGSRRRGKELSQNFQRLYQPLNFFVKGRQHCMNLVLVIRP